MAYDSKSNPTLDVIIPVRNEKATIERLLDEVESILVTEKISVKFICVDDGSMDNTYEVLKRQSQIRNGRFLAIRLSRGFGKDSALLAGIRKSTGNVVVTIDADGEHPPKLLPLMLEKWRNGVLVVNGQKLPEKCGSYFRRIVRKSYNMLFTRLSGFDFEGASDYKLFDQRVAKELAICEERYFFFRGMVPWLGFTQESVPFLVRPSSRQSRWNFYQLFRMTLNSIILYSDIILYSFMLIGSVMFAVSSLLFLKLLFQIIFASVPQGYATLLTLLLVIITMNICTVAILGLFAKRNLDETIRRPSYVSWMEAGELEPQKSVTEYDEII